VIFPKEDYDDLSYIWRGEMDLDEYGQNNLSWIIDAPGEGSLPALALTPDNEIRLDDFDKDLKDKVYDSDSMVVSVSFFSFFLIKTSYKDILTEKEKRVMNVVLYY